ncbi:MAG TPA: FAD-dependent thymidylate synthase [Dehalococcoidia bacterium]|nr:FAD-dependent thymidylate synthase [Dehalococcoidia bacterium]
MTVELLGHLGDDLAIVNAARVSYGRESRELTERDAGLIRFLARERHGTPFEHVVFTFRVTTSIAVAREWFRHRMGSFNEISTRYVEMNDEFYLPPPENVRRQVGKPGAYHFEPVAEDEARAAIEAMRSAYEHAYQAYKELLDSGVAKELARNVLPLGMLTQFIWTVNFRSVTNFLSLRTASNALLEIRQEAQQVEELVEKVLPHAYAAWVEGGRASL